MTLINIKQSPFLSALCGFIHETEVGPSSDLRKQKFSFGSGQAPLDDQAGELALDVGIDVSRETSCHM